MGLLQRRSLTGRDTLQVDRPIPSVTNYQGGRVDLVGSLINLVVDINTGPSPTASLVTNQPVIAKRT